MATLEHNESTIKESLHTFDDPVLLNCKSGAEYLLFQLQPFNDTFTQLISVYENINDNKDLNETNFLKLIKYINTFTNLITDLVVSGKITSITAAALQQGQSKALFKSFSFVCFSISNLIILTALAELARDSGQISLEIITKMKKKETFKNESDKLNETVKKVIENLNELLPKALSINKDEIGDLVDQEMHKTTEAIEQAVSKLEALINKSREKETGVKLEVNDKILDSCTELMKAIKILIIKAKELQKEIVAQGRVIKTIVLLFMI